MGVDPERFERYVDKIDHARERLDLVDAWGAKAAGELHWRLATYKAFQEAAEALADILAMAVVDSGRPAKDDYKNISLAADRGIIDDAWLGPLGEATGLRNRLVHEYETLDDSIALTSMGDLIEPMRSALEEVEAWLNSKT